MAWKGRTARGPGGGLGGTRRPSQGDRALHGGGPESRHVVQGEGDRAARQPERAQCGRDHARTSPRKTGPRQDGGGDPNVAAEDRGVDGGAWRDAGALVSTGELQEATRPGAACERRRRRRAQQNGRALRSSFRNRRTGRKVITTV